MSIKDKALRINFASLPGTFAPISPEPSASASASNAKRPKTAPGAMMAFANDARSALMEENEILRAKANQTDQLESNLGEALSELRAWDGVKPTRLIDPAQIVGSRYANRHVRSFETDAFAALKAEIGNAGGNVQPIKVRPLATSQGSTDEPERFEVVYGHRRHEACRQLGLPVLALVDNLDDQSLFIEMDRENRQREDLSAWEQGCMYRRALDNGLFPSNRKLAEALGVDLTNLGRALAIARLPEDVIAAFASPLDLQFRWARPLISAIETDSDGVRLRAKELTGKAGLSAKDIFQRLITPAPQKDSGSTGDSPKRIEIKVAGKHCGTVRVNTKGGTTIEIEPGTIASDRLTTLVSLVEQFLAAGNQKK